jgi:hypothetical protein
VGATSNTVKSKSLSIYGLEYILTGSGRVALHDAPFATRHPSLARLACGAGLVGMLLGALNPGIAVAGQQYHPEADTTVTAVGAAPTDAPAQYRVRRHLARAAPAPQLAYVVPIDDGTELGIANLDTADAQIAVYSSAPTISAVPVRLTVPAGGFAWVTPQTGLFAALSVAGATPDLVQIIAQRTHTVNGHVLTETVPAVSIDELIPAGRTGWIPGPENPAWFGNAVGVTQGVLMLTSKDPAELDILIATSGGYQVDKSHYVVNPWSSILVPDIYRACRGGFGCSPAIGDGNWYVKIVPTVGTVMAFGLLTDTTSGQQSTLAAVQNTDELTFAVFLQRRVDGVTNNILQGQFTDVHVINPNSPNAVDLLMLFRLRDDSDHLFSSIGSHAFTVVSSGFHYAWPDSVLALFFAQGYGSGYGDYGAASGYGVDWTRNAGDGTTVLPLLVWANHRMVLSYGDIGHWAPALRPSDACGGAQQVPCSLIGLTHASRLELINNSATNPAIMNIDYYDALGKRLETTQKVLGPGMDTEIADAPDGTVRAVLRNPVGNTGSFYALAFTPNGGDGEDYQQAKPLPNS